MNKTKAVLVIVEAGDDICLVLHDAMVRGQMIIAEDNDITSEWLCPEDEPLIGLTAERDDLPQILEMVIQDDMIPEYGKRGKESIAASGV
jgi:hypothetical protein